jgi:hypothetical protein
MANDTRLFPTGALPTGCTCGADIVPGRADREAHADSCPRRNPVNVADAIAELDDPLSFGTEDDEDEVAAIPLPDQMFRIPSGKYKGIVLPRMLNVKPSYLDKVLALKEEIVHDPEFQQRASTIAHTYAELRREAERKSAELSELKLRLTAVMLLMIDQFENEQESGLTLMNGDKVRWNPEPSLIVTDKEAFRQWCLTAGVERDMVLPWGKANKLIKDMLMEGVELPPGAEAFVRPKVTFTKGVK